MKILYLHQYFSTPAGAGGTRSYYLARSLVEAGHQVQMVCLRDARSHTGLSGSFTRGLRTGLVDGITVVEFDLPYSNYLGLFGRSLVFLRYSWLSLKLALHSDADLVFATTTPLTAGIPGIAARWLRGVPFVFEVRELWPELPRAMGVVRNPLVLAGLSALEWLSYHSADACIGLAPGICEGIAERGIEPSLITSIPNACDLELFQPQPSGKMKQPQLISGLPAPFPPNSFVAAFTGAHGLANGLDAVLDVAAELQHLGRQDIQLLFIGDGRCKPALQQRVASEGLVNCHFLPLIPQLQLAEILRQSVHVGLMVFDDFPAFYCGTSPNKFFDYLACGLPVVINYPGWLAELIQEHQLGIPVSPRDSDAFAAALITLAEQPALVASMGSNARSLAESRFSRRLLADQCRQVLETTATRYARRRNGYLGQQTYALFKDLADWVAALVALLLLSPLLVVVVLLVRWQLDAPVLFRQQRPGYRGRPFELLKFRTMTSARDASGTLLPDAQRLTPLCRWLRSTSIDELPGLINILRGEMSFIGPRPLLMQYLPLYSSDQARRHDVKPGFSGWAQINGRNAISWEEKFRLDVWYVDHQDFWLDLRIFLITILKVIRREGISAAGEATMSPFTGSSASQ
ncbi:sugar transferase [Cyanobium sp. HWJ4-Hawea]|uniref:sugar transferase n=1 Tax=Cyanobium sp. HWJ4-Hawea TaxID=2823713 RepID=UPI0028F442F7|nr:sugar transferase [Cyanobium sp. HWJ4-Hawea]MCP9808474.1 sugar transferase [Cyanobium sp. HWJ4-Hawea]